MSASEARSAITDIDTHEVVPGAQREELEGWVPDLASPDELREALEKAFNYRGDVSVTLKNGSKVDGYIFDRRTGDSLDNSLVRIYLKDSTEKLSVRYSDIAGLAFTGRDTAAGKSWEAWVRKYWEKKMAGETNIALEPDSLEAD